MTQQRLARGYGWGFDGGYRANAFPTCLESFKTLWILVRDGGEAADLQKPVAKCSSDPGQGVKVLAPSLALQHSLKGQGRGVLVPPATLGGRKGASLAVSLGIRTPPPRAPVPFPLGK